MVTTTIRGPSFVTAPIARTRSRGDRSGAIHIETHPPTSARRWMRRWVRQADLSRHIRALARGEKFNEFTSLRRSDQAVPRGDRACEPDGGRIRRVPTDGAHG